MAQQAAIDHGAVRRSLSDRPAAIRFGVNLWRFIIHKPLGGFGVFLIVGIVLVATFAPQIQRYDPDDVFKAGNPAYDPEIAAKALEDPTIRLKYPPEVFQDSGVIEPQDPSSAHWLGTDRAGRDLWSRIVWGARLSLLVGIGAALIAVSTGLVFGTTSAYFGGIVDLVIQRVTDALMAFPALILLLLIVQVVDNPDKYWITIALGIVGISSVIRVVRSAVLSARQEVYVTAAQVVGATDLRIMVRHILPNIMAPTIVIFTISIGSYILAEASLNFIGFGDPTAISWGKMVNDGRQLLPAKPMMSLFSGGAIMVSVLGFNLAGDALRDVLDPRLRGRGGRAGF